MHTSINIQEFCTGRADYPRAVHSLPQIFDAGNQDVHRSALGPAPPEPRTDRRGARIDDRAPIGDMAVQHGEQDLVVDAWRSVPRDVVLELVGCGPSSGRRHQIWQPMGGENESGRLQYQGIEGRPDLDGLVAGR